MIAFCRHILNGGVLCQQAAIKGTHLCRHHGVVKTTLAVARRPAPYGVPQPLPFVLPEDRASIQLNYLLVLEALNDQKIDNRTANTMNRILRSCEMNLSKGPLIPSDHARTARRVILTPEGEEIGQPREGLEEGESTLIHRKECPCQRCAEEFREAAPEQHHANCKCGLCEEVGADSAVRTASARKLLEKDLVVGPEDTHSSLDRFLYGDAIAEHEAQYAERVQAAREAGVDPPAYEPWDKSKYVPEGIRLYKERMAEIERNKQAARESFKKLYPNDPEEEEEAPGWEKGVWVGRQGASLCSG
jgi:hypothetical protein